MRTTGGSGARFAGLVWTGFAILAIAASPGRAERPEYPETPQVPVADTLHGVVIVDPYRWLEDGEDPRVVAWTEEEERLTRSRLDPLPQRATCMKRFDELWRYDDEGVPDEVIDGERAFYWVKRKDDEKIRYYTRETADSPGRELINPNDWDPTETLDGFTPSRDGRYVAIGKARGGDESPVIRILEVDTGRILPDTLRGWRQGAVSWLPGNVGFYYGANPLAGEVPAGEEHYWYSAYYHELGTPASQDRKVFSHPEVKEHYHWVGATEDARHVLLYRWASDKNEVYFAPIGSDSIPTPIATGFDARYIADMIGDRIYITTDRDAPMFQVFVTDAAHPGREHWKLLIPEDKERKLTYVNPIAGKLYAAYQYRAHTEIKIFDPEGRYLRDLPLPTIGSASVSGYWSKDDVWVRFSSYTYPPATYKYDFDSDDLALYKKFPLDIDVTGYTVDQVWYPSKDGTQVSMFLVRRKEIDRDGGNPVLLTGYGGFSISMTPYFSTSYVVWLESGGMIAVANLRGGGEYGREWHEAGRLEKKQNVFDDFIGAAEWLIREGYTSPAHLAIEGGSNGGLLVGAVAVQRPELFRAVLCEVPLLDMIRYHRFGLANIWAKEYGSAEDPEQFAYLYRYSPYHNVKDGARFPAMLIVGSENDARVDPLHARKMAARLQAADAGEGPILLLVQKRSGHGGGTTLTTRMGQHADGWAFLMDRLGMQGGGK